MLRIYKKMCEEKAGVIVENAIILPFAFIIICALLLTSFIVYDRCAVEAAAARGVVYASHCINDPNYADLVGGSGELEVSYDTNVNTAFSFSGVGDNIHAYRYLIGGNDIEDDVESTVRAIVDKTRISWTPQEVVSVECSQENMFLYQEVSVTVSTSYSIPVFFAAFGLETDYEYAATARGRITDPDEFIRNADLVVDLMTAVDEKTGGHVEKAMSKISELATKIADWTLDKTNVRK